jgi:NADPH:quinone reductase-like Zn-dependent oxidoreductase
MKALVFTDLGVVKIQDVPDVIAGEGEVVIAVDRAASHHGSRVRWSHV